MTLIERIHFGDNKKRGRERRYRHRRIFFGKAPFLFRLLRRCELNNAIEFQLNYIQIIEALFVQYFIEILLYFIINCTII